MLRPVKGNSIDASIIYIYLLPTMNRWEKNRNKQHGSILGFDRKKVIVNPFFPTHSQIYYLVSMFGLDIHRHCISLKMVLFTQMYR